MTYHAPVDDIVFALKVAGRLDEHLAAGLYGHLDHDTVVAILEEAGTFGAEVLAPLNSSGDRSGSEYNDGIVTTPAGFREAYKQFISSGWNALPSPENFGGQSLPELVSLPVSEIWNAANLAFGLCPLLTQGAIHAIEAGGSAALKAKYLPKMVEGKWSGTMNLTEPHAGSDLSALKCMAQPQADGTYKIVGTKIFITYGEHDLTENIIHLVLARLPDAPEGTRGISLFVVPKYLVNPDGTLGSRNDVVCAGIEHKLGIHASPTCVMKYGEQGGAIGELVGAPNKGLATMFVMMNAARLAVGMQGVAVGERATQRAMAYAKERCQGRSGSFAESGMSPIIEHPDVRRMLLTMKALTQAARMICIATAAELDLAYRSSDSLVRAAASQRAALLTPVAKAFSTDASVEIASMGIQIHGGMGFVEEAGAAQHLRDARILPIYEGTNGIQAIDLVLRKLPIDGGKVVGAYLEELHGLARQVATSNRPEFGHMGDRLLAAVAALQAATVSLTDSMQSNTDRALAVATPYLRLFGLTAGAAYLAKGALAVGAMSPRIALARYFAEILLPETNGLSEAISTGADSVLVMGRVLE